MVAENPFSVRVAELDALVMEPVGAEHLPLLAELSELIAHHDPERAVALVKESIGLAERLDDPSEQPAPILAQCLLHAAKIHYMLADYDESWRLLARVETILPKDAADLRIEALVRRAGLHHVGDNDVEALNALTTALDLCDEESPRRTELLIKSGFVYTGLGLYDRALTALLDALERMDRYGSERSELPVICHSHFADVYGALGDLERMREHARQGIALADPAIPSHRPQIVALSTILGLDAWGTGSPDEALDYFRSGLDLLGANEQLAHRSQILMHVGQILAEEGEREQGKEVLREALELAEEVGPPSAGASIHVAIADVLRTEGDLLGAVEHLKETLSRTEESSHSIRARALADLAKLYEELGEKEASYACYREHVELRERLRGEDVQRRIARITLEYELAQAGNERDALREQADRLENEAARARRELSTAALNLMRKREGLRKLKQDLVQEARNGSRQQRGLANDLIDRIDEQLAGDEDWDRFENRLDAAHADFVMRLSRLSPNLSPTELRICALLRIDLSTKEIADLLSISLNTAHTHRRNIRRKLGLGERGNLVAYLVRV